MDLRTARNLSPREYHERRKRELHEAAEQRREQTLAELREAVLRQAPRFPALRAVYVFGSLRKPGRFHEGSDIDLAIECDDYRSEAPFARALEAELRIDVDLRPHKDAIAAAVEEEGEKLYG